MNRLLLIGGDLCERAALRLNSATWHCTGLRRRAMPDTDDTPIRWIQADLADRSELAVALAEISSITHILYAPAPGERTPQTYATVYPQGLQSLLDSLVKPQQLQRCVLVDSTAVWGPSDDWVDENTPTDPQDFRGRLMLEAESVLHNGLASPRFPDASGVVLRLSGLYGPGRLRLIEGLRTRSIAAPGGPGHWANRIHVDDAAQACVHLLKLDQPETCYIGTDDHPLPTTDLYDALARMVGTPAPARAPRAPDGKRLSNARLRARGWAPRWPDMISGYAECLKNT